MFDLTHKDLKVVNVNMSNNFKEILIKGVKEHMMTKPHEVEILINR